MILTVSTLSFAFPGKARPITRTPAMRCLCSSGCVPGAIWPSNSGNISPPSALTGVVFAFLIFGLAVILANFYYPQYHSSLNTISGRLNSVTAGLEFAALVIGLACIMLGEPVVVTWMLFATALLVASDIAYSEMDVPSAIEPVWMLGQFLLLSALIVLPGAMDAVPPPPATRSSPEDGRCEAAVRAIRGSHPAFARRCAPVGGPGARAAASGLEVIFLCPVCGGAGGGAGVDYGPV